MTPSKEPRTRPQDVTSSGEAGCGQQKRLLLFYERVEAAAAFGDAALAAALAIKAHKMALLKLQPHALHRR
jgi:hypothetical protein